MGVLGLVSYEAEGGKSSAPRPLSCCSHAASPQVHHHCQGIHGWVSVTSSGLLDSSQGRCDGHGSSRCL